MSLYGDAKVDLDVGARSWEILSAASEGDEGASQQLGKVRHPALDAAWKLGSKKKQKDACWKALVGARSLGNPEATDLLAAFLAHDPVRSLPKIAEHRPRAIVIAEPGELVDLRPLRKDSPIPGRLIWLLDASEAAGQISWPKIADRSSPATTNS